MITSTAAERLPAGLTSLKLDGSAGGGNFDVALWKVSHEPELCGNVCAAVGQVIWTHDG